MAIYFGSTGFVEIKRDNGRAFSSSLDPADVNTTKKRFSVDFASGAILTGDQVVISTKDDSNLELVSGHNHPDGRWYVHIDDAGGMKLYNNFASSLAGDSSTALTLAAPSAAKDITIQSQGTRYRTLGKVREFEITTTRDTIDINSLGEDFRQRYERGMISGQGNMQCIWQHRAFQGDTLNIAEPEFPVYLAQLAVRLDQGADFFGRFFIYHDPAQTQTSVWYEAECSVTNVAINVPAAGIVEATIDFVTTGDIALHTGQPPAYLLQENTDKILQEDGQGILLEDPTS